MRGRRSLRSQLVITFILAAILAGGVNLAFAAKQAVPLISKEELKPGIGAKELIIIDVRIGKDWNASQKKIKGAVREDPDQVEVWAKKYKHHQDIVLYCA